MRKDKTKYVKKGMLLSDNSENEIIADGRKLLEENGFSKEDIEYYADRMIAVLDDYTERFGANTEIEYTARKRFGRLETTVLIPGDNYDPFENGNDSKRRKIEKTLSLNMDSQEACINHSYRSGNNVITGSVSTTRKKELFIKDPVIWAIILGVIVGIICLNLPENANQFVIEDVLDPINSILLKVLSGVMGPVIFISLVTSITALKSVNDLTNLGFKIFKRFILIILLFILVSIGVTLIFTNNSGGRGIDFSPNQIVSMLLDIIPINIVSPFLNNNTPQLVVLAFVAGVALLLLGDRVKDLNNILHQVNDWIMNIMKLVNKILPLIPFFSIAILIGKGNASVLVDGWKFIAASYIIFTLCIVFKMVKFRVVTKMSPMDVLKKSKPAILTALSTSSTAAPLGQIYDISKNELHIKPEFSSFWVPMCSAMLALKTTVNVVVATIMMTEILGLSITLSFLFVLVLLTVEMSLASPGTTGSWVIAFEAFSMPTSYVGLFATYRVFTVNYATGAVIAFNMLEQVEAAYKMDALDVDPDPGTMAEQNA